MNIGIIGAGNRSTAYLSLCLSDLRDNIRVKAMADTNADHLEEYVRHRFEGKEYPEIHTDYTKLLDDKEIDAVFICTPDFSHRDITIDALKAEKHILLEKPMATTIEGCKDIYDESLKHNNIFRLGFVLRYTDFYKKIKEIVSSGIIGRVISVQANEVLGASHAGSFFRRWHRFKVNNGGFLNAKCSHDLDILNWIIDAEPSYVSAFGSRTFFNPIIGAAEHCPKCRLKHTCRYYVTTDNDPVESIHNSCVFNNAKDIVDHEVVNIEYENGVTLSFTVCMLSNEANRTTVIYGSDATVYADMLKKTITVKFIKPENEIKYAFSGQDYGHFGGDAGIFEDFVDSTLTGKDSEDHARAGFLSSAIALAAEVSMEEKRSIDLCSFAGFHHKKT